ncbi:MAG TPA: histidine kinase [Bacteroidales bacterium]
MKQNNPFKKLSILNIWFISVCTLFIFSFTILFRNERGPHDAILGAALTFITLLFTCSANILWLYIFKNPSISGISNKKRVYYTLSYTFSIFIFLVVVLTYNYSYNQSTNLIDISSLIIISGFVNSLIVIFNNYIVLQDAKVNADMENSLLKAANAEAANQLLRQQIHPHFFFNALNILKSLYKIDPEAAEEYLVSLSDFLRISLSGNNIKLVQLKDELQLCQDYLGMQKIRFGDALKCSVSIPESILENGFVPSFSIQPLLENAIKHNELTKASPLHISIVQDGDRIKVSNNIKTKATTETSTGIGLANLSQRYRILSGDEIFIDNDGAIFSVSIKILDKKVLSKESV